MAVRIDVAGATPSLEPALVVAASAARQAASATARLATRMDVRGGPADPSTGTGSFHAGVARARGLSFVKPSFTVGF